MKTCRNCKSPFVQLELSSVIRGYAILDVLRLLLLLGPMLSFFYACTNIHPMPPHVRFGVSKHIVTRVDYVLYAGNRTGVSEIEQVMLANVEKGCTKEYRDDLPSIWSDAKPTLYKALILQGIAMCLPVTTAGLFLIFQKKDTVSSAIALAHFILEVFSIIFSFYGAYFISDSRLCFLSHFSPSFHVPILVWSMAIFCAVFYKIGILYCLELYLRHYCKSRTFTTRPQTPFSELQSYLRELKELDIPPKIKPLDLPEDETKRDWEYVSGTVKRILQEVRVQIAELHKDDPVVDDIIKAGKLRQGSNFHHNQTRKHGGSATSFETTGTGTGPSVLKIARMMANNKNAEYTLLKQHQYHHGQGGKPAANKDDVEIILPEHNFRYDPEF